jgi:hypothetical protein
MSNSRIRAAFVAPDQLDHGRRLLRHFTKPGRLSAAYPQYTHRALFVDWVSGHIDLLRTRSQAREKAAAGLRSAAASIRVSDQPEGHRHPGIPWLIFHYRLSRLACETSRWRLRFLIDRRRRFMVGPRPEMNRRLL